MIQNVIVSEDFEKLHDKMKAVDKRSLRIIHGGVLFQPKRLTLPENDPEIAFQVIFGTFQGGIACKPISI